ncbi:hypothetical protein FDC58_15065 [Clostridium botulinum]|uniref:Uncharacterized protein n=1 Tax=Clostridium botulinum TaxID=1491 RepID=A0A0A0UTW0_CLOBO|nr:hypothetical protein [Clostridium botulinum]AIW54588.1 hypothetical protein [Clostridium botulinum]AIW54708.1 hypothetical protein [Clostridium botulinum]AIW54770.1 hypothetical protein [Clostridium botulinum]AIW54837.1 hypothetical protein [Clostridium botulinum]MBY7009290.1 hypothetical protein [Clostridium botulinum]
MTIDRLMKELNCYSFNKEQLDIIDNYSIKERNNYKYFFYVFIVSVFMNMFIEHFKISNILNLIISIILIAAIIKYLYFIMTMKKNLLKDLKTSICK